MEFYDQISVGTLSGYPTVTNPPNRDRHHVLLQVLEDTKRELLTSFKDILDALNLLFSAHEFLTTHGKA